MVVSAGERFSPPAIPWRQHIKDLGPEHPLVAQGLLLTGVGFDLSAIKCHVPKTHHAGLLALPQDVNKQTLDLSALCLEAGTFTQPACLRAVLAALLPVAALVVSGAPALSQPLPAVAPSHEQLAPAPGAPTAQVGVAVRRLGGQSLDHDFRALQGRELRMRELTIAPGGSITLHRHDQRPGVAYILEGQMTEWRGPGFTPRVIGPGEAVFETTGVSHWWRNQGTTPARALVVDIVPVSAP